MQTTFKYAVLAVVAGAVAWVWATPSAGSSHRDLTPAEVTAVLDNVFDGRPRTALVFLDSLQQTCDGEPLYLLMRARCVQEQIPMDDEDTDRGRELSKPALETLERCIDVCSERLDEREPDPKYNLYRGWAWMARAYVHSMTRSMYSAGRDAGRGKKDLERYLAIYPDDPTAKGLLGSFLYFADAVPNLFKFLSKLLFLPSGDRVRGLELLEDAVRGGGMLETDWCLILYNVYFYFEGRFEEGLAGLQEMNQRYPAYGRTAVALAVSRIYAPRSAAKHDVMVTQTVNQIYGKPHGDVDWNALYLVQFYRAYGDRFCNDSGATMVRLRGIIHEAPRHPDWVESFARLELGRLYASRGDRQRAVELFEIVKETSPFGDLRDEAERLLDDVDTYGDYLDRAPTVQFDRWITTLYDADPDSLRVLETRFQRLAPSSLIAKFYLGETMLLSGELGRAYEAYSEVIQEDAPSWDHTYQLIASTRIGEIHAARGQYESAARFAAYSMNFYHGEYLLDWVIEGRRGYFERLASGEEHTPPTLLTSNPTVDHPRPPGTRRL